jgi:dihydrofolate reductase
MRRILLFDNVSADGYFAREDGRLDWVVPDDEVYKATTRANDSIDTVLFGRRTYDMFESFWPKALEQPNTPDPHTPTRTSPAMHDMAVFLNEAKKIVFSRTRKAVTWNNSQLVPEFDPARVEAMKKEPGKDIIVFGSGSIVARLTQAGLIDEYLLVVSPVLLGAGRSWLAGVTKTTQLEQAEAQRFPSGVVLLRYARKS